MIVYQLVYLLPALLVVAAGFQVRARWKGESQAARWPQFLVLALAVLLLLMIALGPTNMGFSLAPAVMGTMAALLLVIPWDPRTWSVQTLKLPALYLAVIAALLVVQELLNPSVSLFLVFPALIIALVWWAWDWQGRWRLVASLFALFMLACAVDAIPSALLSRIPEWAETVISNLAGPWPLVAVVLLARLTLSTLWPERPLNWGSLPLRAIIATLLLLSVAYQIVTYMAWDTMTDGLMSAMTIGFIGYAAVAAAMLWAWKWEDWRRGAVSATVFALVFLIAPQFPLLNGMWPSSVQMTAERAAQVDQAVQRYQAQTGSYPASLADLSPWYLWRIPEPIMIRDVTWCYEGGADYYRLGYVFHPGFDARASVKLLGSAGTPPSAAWRCDELAAQYNTSPYLH